MTDQPTETEFAAGSGKDGEAVPAKPRLPKDARAIVADARNDITIPFFSNVLQPTDDTLIKRGKGKGLALYDEIERDTHAGSVLQKRKKTLVSREWIMKPGGDDQRDLDAAEFCEEKLRAPPFDRICDDFLDATLRGFSVGEAVWAIEGGWVVPKAIKSHDQRRFVFGVDWSLRLLTRENIIDGEELPDRKFITHRHGVKGNNPYALGLGSKLFWAVKFKREGVAFWLTFLEKFAMPTVHGKVPYGLAETEEIKLLASLASASKQASIVTPMDVEVDMLEAARSGSISYEAWCQYWDRQISICVNGETLTTDVEDKGSRAAGEVHADMLAMLVDADGDLLSDTLRDTLLTWMVEFNFPGAKVPSLWRIRSANEQAEAETEEKKAKAAGEREMAIRQVVVSAAELEDDKAALDYIAGFAPGDLEADMLDTLVAARFAFASRNQAEADQLKKKT